MSTNLPVSTQTLPALGMQVEHLLLSGKAVEDLAASMIADGLVEELRTKVPVLYSTASRRAELDGIKRALTPWFATYPQPERSDPEWLAFWQGYVVACGHQPEAALVGAMEAWAKFPDSEFLPKPGRLAEIAAKTPTAAFKLAGRAHQVLQLADDRMDRQRVAAGMQRDKVKPEEQVQAVSQMLADFKAKSIAGAKRVPPEGDKGPYIGGRLATGSALTPEMLRHLGRPVPPPPDPRDPVEFDF